jgi:predicted GNAT family N-acyltransferase
MTADTPGWERSGVTAKQVDWKEHGAHLLEIRSAVFADDPAWAAEAGPDQRDREALHVLARVDGEPVGTGRLLLPEGRITRLAVLGDSRGQGIGSMIMEELMELARRQGLHEIYLHTPCDKTRFYARHGFTLRGAVFTERGEPHCRMVRTL